MNRYQYTKVTGRRTPTFGTTKYPVVPLSSSDIYVITQEEDRYDQLAQQYYGDSSLWWVISSANQFLKQDSYYIPLGTQIRIPSNIGAIIANYDLQNQRR